MSVEHREHLLDIIKYSTEIVSTSEVVIENDIYSLEVLAYDTLSRTDFPSCSNVYCSVQTPSGNTYIFYLDLYKEKFEIGPHGGSDYGDWYINVDNFMPFYPLTEESFFQMQLIFDLKDLTFEECRDIMNLCVQIPSYEDFT